MRSVLHRVRAALAATGLLALAAAGTTVPAAAAPHGATVPRGVLTPVTDFGDNPTGLAMHVYVPASVRPHPAVLVVVHYCTGSGPAMYTGTQYASLADRYGFVVVYPSATREGHCFDVSTPQALRHDGRSDPAGIVSMVRWTQRALHADRHRTYVTGISSGAMTTNVLLADHPDVFAAGSAMSGVPYHCFATTDGSLWNSDCAQGKVDLTPRQWGDLVRAAYPGYHGPRPRIQLWHGTADEVLLYPNLGEEVQEWTDVLHARLAQVDHPRPTWTHSVSVDHRGRVAVDAYSVAGGTHNLAFEEPGVDELAVHFFGLDRR